MGKPAHQVDRTAWWRSVVVSASGPAKRPPSMWSEAVSQPRFIISQLGNNDRFAIVASDYVNNFPDAAVNPATTSIVVKHHNLRSHLDLKVNRRG
jgi:hypothetical protein